MPQHAAAHSPALRNLNGVRGVCSKAHGELGFKRGAYKATSGLQVLLHTCKCRKLVRESCWWAVTPWRGRVVWKVRSTGRGGRVPPPQQRSCMGTWALQPCPTQQLCDAPPASTWSLTAPEADAQPVALNVDKPPQRRGQQFGCPSLKHAIPSCLRYFSACRAHQNSHAVGPSLVPPQTVSRLPCNKLQVSATSYFHQHVKR